VIIDAHVHLGQSSDFRLSARQLVSMMDRNSVSKAVAVPMASSQKHNERLLKELRHYSDRLVGFVWVNPRSLGTLGSLQDLGLLAGFGGFKLRSESDIFRIDDIRLLKPIFETARRLQKPIFIHSSGEGSFSDPNAIGRIAAAFPDVTIVIGHMGGGTYGTTRVGHKYSNIMLETSGPEDPRIVLEAVRTLGPERVVFGSDLPYCSQSEEIAKIEALSLPTKQKEMVMGKNAERILGL